MLSAAVEESSTFADPLHLPCRDTFHVIYGTKWYLSCQSSILSVG